MKIALQTLSNLDLSSNFNIAVADMDFWNNYILLTLGSQNLSTERQTFLEQMNTQVDNNIKSLQEALLLSDGQLTSHLNTSLNLKMSNALRLSQETSNTLQNSELGVNSSQLDQLNAEISSLTVQVNQCNDALGKANADSQESANLRNQIASLETQIAELTQMKANWLATQAMLESQIANLQRERDALAQSGQSSKGQVQNLTNQIEDLRNRLEVEKAKECPTVVDRSSEITALEGQIAENERQMLALTNDLAGRDVMINMLKGDKKKLEGFQMSNLLYLVVGIGVGVSGYYAYQKYKS